MVDNIIRLDRNESPYPPPRIVLDEIRKTVSKANRYPSRELYDRLLYYLSNYTEVSTSHIVVNGGSDHMLELVTWMFAGDKGVTLVYPCFNVFVELLKLHGIKYRLVSMDYFSDKPIDLGELITYSKNSDLVYIDNPNNPSGRIMVKPKEIEELVIETREKPIIVIDEAYYEFSKVTAASLIESYDNLIVLRTFSKAWALAGLRIGYALAGKRALEAFYGMQYRVSLPALAGAIKALENSSYMYRIVKRIIDERERLRRKIRVLGLKTPQSSANYLLIFTGIKNIPSKLKHHGIYVKDYSHLGEGAIRVTIGNRRENRIFLNTLKEILLHS